VNAATPGSEGDYGVYQSLGHGFVSGSLAVSCSLMFEVGCLTAIAGGSEHGGLAIAGGATVFGLGTLTNKIVDLTQALLDEDC
jgi:hypothetical protein